MAVNNNRTYATLNDLENSPVSVGTGTNTYIAFPKDGRFRTKTGNITGLIKIRLPQSWSSTMMMFDVDIYNYVTNETLTYRIGGYNYNTGSWNNASACCMTHGSNSKRNLPVRFGHDGTKCAVTIGEASTVWKYPQITVRNITIGYNNAAYEKWSSGWDVSITTTALSTIDQTITNPYVGNGGMAATLQTARTINGTSFNGSANITTAKWGTARNITIGNTTKSVDGAGNVSWTLAEIGAGASTSINSRGNVTAETGTNRPAVNGLSMSQAYNNGYPTAYGNVITMKGSGDGQILIGWSGTSGAVAPSYIRSKRDTSDASWSEWERIGTITDTRINAIQSVVDSNKNKI